MKINYPNSIKSIILKYLIGLFFAVSLALLSSFTFDLISRAGFYFEFGGDKSVIFIMICFGIPFGSVTGFIIADKYISKIAKINWGGIILGCLFSSVFGLVSSIAIIMNFDSQAIFIIPVVVSFIALIGYQVTYIFK